MDAKPLLIKVQLDQTLLYVQVSTHNQFSQGANEKGIWLTGRLLVRKLSQKQS